MRGLLLAVIVLVLLMLACLVLTWRDSNVVVVGSKNFPESYILGEAIARLLEDQGFRVERRFGLGGTLIGFEALRIGGLDVYIEYSGTLEQAILKSPSRLTYSELQAIMKREYGMDFLESLGFNNAYALALRREQAQSLHLRAISDLTHHPNLRFGLTHDFLERHDGWSGLARAYGLTAQPSAVEHGLSYPAIQDGKLDVTDAYITDGDIRKFDMVLLEDDRNYFPKYLGAPLVRPGVDERVKSVLSKLACTLTNAEMQSYNALVSDRKMAFPEVAELFLRDKGLLFGVAESATSGKWTALRLRVIRHLQLTLLALAGGLMVAIPLGILVYRFRRIAKPLVYFAGMLQTIPSIALLAFMIPLFGIGQKPAIAALFLYSLLPILRNTATALFSIDPILKKVSVGMGLTTWQRLCHIELPLAVPSILAGIKTAAVINIGTATLAAYIGAGGLGDPIVTGLALYDPAMIMEGAIPAALLAIFTELGFEFVERLVVPRHLLQKPAE